MSSGLPSGLAVAEVEDPGEATAGATTIGGGELLLPGEIALAEGESYTTPWVYLAATGPGLDGLPAQFHGYLRSLPAHPRSPRPVNLNVWEAVYFRHDLDKLTALADAAAGLAWNASSWTTAGSRAPQRPGRAGRLVGRRARLAGRIAPARRSRPGPRHAVRALDRARDGQPGLRPVPRPPGLDPVRRAPACRRCSGISWSST